MAITFSGTPTVSDPSSFGSISLPVRRTIRTKIREAIAYGLKNTITKSNDYFLNIGEVHVNAPANDSQRKKWPSLDVIWVRERYTNNVQGNNSLGGYNKIGTVLITGRLFAKGDNDHTIEDITTLEEQLIGDIEKYFGTYYYIPGETDTSTAFNCILVDNEVAGIQNTAPKGSVALTLEVYYRILLTDPTQDF